MIQQLLFFFKWMTRFFGTCKEEKKNTRAHNNYKRDHSVRLHSGINNYAGTLYTLRRLFCVKAIFFSINFSRNAARKCSPSSIVIRRKKNKYGH